jgi:hypothetical protein
MIRLAARDRLTANDKANAEARQMTIDDFRHIALTMPGVVESNGLGYANFRVGLTSFATIEDSMAVIRLTRDQQAMVVATAPDVFAPEPGGWGHIGSTVVELNTVDEAAIQNTLAMAWSNAVNAGPRGRLELLIDRLQGWPGRGQTEERCPS